MILTSIPHCGMTVKPRAALASGKHKMSVAYELKQGQFRQFHKLPSGLNMEVIFQKGDRENDEKPPPLVFVHGSFHAAWCWAEHWLPFFSRHGFDCYALSLLAQVFYIFPWSSIFRFWELCVRIFPWCQHKNLCRICEIRGKISTLGFQRAFFSAYHTFDCSCRK